MEYRNNLKEENYIDFSGIKCYNSGNYTKGVFSYMKKILFFIAMLSAMFFATSAFAIEGEGTEESPFLITTQEELLLINDFPDCNFKLMNDIELEGDWVPLCTYNDGFTGTFDGNDHTISNLKITCYYDMYRTGLFSTNTDGTIKNIKIIILNSIYSERYAGGIVGYNNGTVFRCKVEGNLYGKYSGGIAGYNSGIISECSTTGTIDDFGIDDTYIGGIAGYQTSEGSILNSYFIGQLIGEGYNDKSYLDDDDYAHMGGITAQTSTGGIKNCYVVSKFSLTSLGYKYAVAPNINPADCCFYDTTVSGLSNANYGTPKTTLAMKMKKTYSDAGWDFDNVWGISSDINDGYPYLLWEYEDNNSVSSEIIAVTSTDDSLKFISDVVIEGEPEILTFGTTFIPLWLFESGSTDVATVSYDNSAYNIQNGQTFGATLTSIPEVCKNMEIVGKSFMEDADGNYTWSAAKYSSVNNATLNSLE